METQAASRYQFGAFEVNSLSGELRKHGIRVRLQDQPFRLLVVLLENPGQIVTREEIQKRIWQGNTFVDFDSSLRVAVRKLRDALGDDAENPLYVETIPKRGYRFLAPVLQVGDATAHVSTDQAPSVTAIDGRPRSRSWAIALATFVLVIVGALAGRYLPHRRAPLSEKDTIVLADFVNSTGDPVFDETLRQGTAVQLEQSPYLTLVSEERIYQTLKMMGRGQDTQLSSAVAREICERTGSAAVLNGSITKLGSEYVLGLRAMNCRDGEVLAEEQAQTARKEDVLKALSGVASKLRTRLGESLATVEKFSTPLPEATTSSLEALKAYSTGRKVAFASGSGEAVPFLRQAVEADPQFAMAHALLGRVYGDLGESELAAHSLTKAYELRQRATERERFFIAANYDRQVTGNLERAQQTLQLWAQMYPRDPDAPGQLSGYTSQGVGNFEFSIAAGKKALDLDPNFTPAYINLAFSDFYLDKFADGESVLHEAAVRNIDVPELLLLRYYIAFLKGDAAEMNREKVRAQGKPGAEDWIAHSESLVLARAGRLTESRAASRHAVELALGAGQRERAGMYVASVAVNSALFGDMATAKRSAKEALELSNGRDVEYAAAFALGLAAETARAEEFARDLEERFPEDVAVRSLYVPTLRALAALHRGEPQKALALLEPAAPYEYAVPGIDFFAFFGGMHATYVRGLAYLAERRGSEAAAEFQKIVSHRGIVLADPLGAVARLQLCRAFRVSGDNTRAKSTYQELSSMWKRAEFSLPTVAQAAAAGKDFGMRLGE